MVILTGLDLIEPLGTGRGEPWPVPHITVRKATPTSLLPESLAKAWPQWGRSANFSSVDPAARLFEIEVPTGLLTEGQGGRLGTVRSVPAQSGFGALGDSGERHGGSEE